MVTIPVPPPNLPFTPNSMDSTGANNAPPVPNNRPITIPPGVVLAAPVTGAQTPGRGVDAPDPFAIKDTRVVSQTPPLLVPSVPAAGDVTAQSLLAPSAFSRPQPPHRNRRLIILLSGTAVVLLLLTALGLVLARFFFTGSEPKASPTPLASVIPTTSTAPVSSSSVSPPAESAVLDVDGDGLTAAEERFYGTNSDVADTDSDGFSDGDEVRAGYDPLGPGKLDSDSDGFPDPDERSFGTDPFNPDTDSDGFTDGDEIKNGFNPLIPSPGDKL